MESYESFGRINQKQRTREALKASAASLMEQGLSPSIGQVADSARVSRSTAYRYFPSTDTLQAEVLLDLTIRDDLARIYQAADEPRTAAERLDRVVQQDHRVVTDHESAFRSALRTFIKREDVGGSGHPRRPGNRLRYLDAALMPLHERLNPQQRRRLVAALALCVGIESFIVTRDVCELSDEEAEEVKRWTAQAVLEQALDDASSNRSP